MHGYGQDLGPLHLEVDKLCPDPDYKMIIISISISISISYVDVSTQMRYEV